MQLSQNRPFSPEQSVPGAMEQEAIIARLVGRIYTVTLVKILAVEGGGVDPVGFVDAANLVQQLDADNNGIPNARLCHLPYCRLQGGSNAVIIDPKVGDIGLACFAMRDITNVKDTKAEGKPPSRREYDYSDGLYIGGFLNGTPSQYIHFLDSGINVIGTGKITMTTPAGFEINASHVQINAPVDTNSTIKAQGDITDNAGTQSLSMAGSRQVFNTHTHHENGQGSNTNDPNQKM